MEVNLSLKIILPFDGGGGGGTGGRSVYPVVTSAVRSKSLSSSVWNKMLPVYYYIAVKNVLNSNLCYVKEIHL